MKKEGTRKNILAGPSLCALLAIALVAVPLAGAQETAAGDYDRAVQVARDGFKEFIAKAIPKQVMAQYKLTPSELKENAELGVPFRLHVMAPDRVASCLRNGCESTDALGAPIDTYLFPIKLNGRIEMMMTVDRFKGKEDFEIGSLGYASLAAEVDNLLKSWSRDKGYTPRLFVCDQAHAYAFSIPEQGGDNLTLLDFESQNQSKYAGLSSVNQVVPTLASKIAVSLGQGE